jgi:glycosyltransferase involved in cell wall biosynthesis
VPRRILLLITDLQIGGTPTVVRELAIRLNDPPSVIVDVGCLGMRGPVADQTESANVRTAVLGARGATDVRVLLRLAGLIRNGHYDTVFSFLIHANVAAALVKPFFPGVRFIQSIQTTQPHPRWHWRLQGIVQHAADRIVVPSLSVATAAAEWADVDAARIVVIPNAIDLADFNPGDNTQQPGHVSAAGAASQPIPIGFIGRLDPIKRVPDLLHAVQLLAGRVHLHIFGQGADRPRIEEAIVRLGVASQVTLHGAIARPQDALGHIALLVLPSAAEGFGLVLIESMAAGVPVVATNVAGIRDVVRNGETGVLVPPSAPEELARAIDRVLADGTLREKLVAGAREEVGSRFSWGAVLPMYRKLLGLV